MENNDLELFNKQRSLMAMDKASIEFEAIKRVEELADSGWGVLNPTIQAAKIAHYLDIFLKKMRPFALQEVREYGKELVRDGVVLTEMEAGVSYDYKADHVWRSLKAEEDKWAVKRRAWESKLRAVKVGGEMLVDEETGEEYLAHRPSKTGTDTVSISIK